jgi:hypothetical protein
MKNASGATRATPLIPIPLNLEVAMTKMIRAVQKTEQKTPAIKDNKKNHLCNRLGVRI